MHFHLPVAIYEEQDCVYKHRTDLAGLGKKALIVTGRHSSKENGALADVTGALDTQHVKYAIFDEIEENPSVETVMRARDFGIAEEADFVIGLGGGSPIDAAKAIAIMIYNRDSSAAFLYEKTDAATALPVAAIPTTCGTGSEATAVSVLTVHEKRTKASLPHRVFPAIALVDAKYLQAAPHKIIAATAVDALGHMIESYINTGATEYSRMFVDAGLRLWRKSRDVITADREPVMEDYRNLMNASTLAGMAIAHDGTTIPHSLSYMLTYEMGLAHGLAVGYFLPGYLREASGDDREYILRTAGFADMAQFEGFISGVCGVEGIPSALLDRTIKAVLDNPVKLASCPYPIDKAVLLRMV